MCRAGGFTYRGNKIQLQKRLERSWQLYLAELWAAQCGAIVPATLPWLHVASARHNTSAGATCSACKRAVGGYDHRCAVCCNTLCSYGNRWPPTSRVPTPRTARDYLQYCCVHSTEDVSPEDVADCEDVARAVGAALKDGDAAGLICGRCYAKAFRKMK